MNNVENSRKYSWKDYWDLIQFKKQASNDGNWVEEEYLGSKANKIFWKLGIPYFWGIVALCGAGTIWYAPKPASMMICILFCFLLGWVSVNSKR